MKYVLYALGGIVGLFLLVFFANAIGLINYSFFGPKYENTRRNIYENTQSYNEGKRQELTKYRLEYLESKDKDDKQAIRMTILQSFANYDENKLPSDLRSFLDEMKN